MNWVLLIKKYKFVFSVLLIAVLMTSVSIVVGSYVISTNHISGTPKALATGTLTSNSSAPNVGDTLMLTAHFSDNIAGVSVVLTDNGYAVGSPVLTDSNGNAVFYVVVSAAYDFVALETHP